MCVCVLLRVYVSVCIYVCVRGSTVEVPTTDSPVYLRPPLESSRLRGKAAAVLQYHNDIKTRMKINCPEIPRGHTQPQVRHSLRSHPASGETQPQVRHSLR